MRSMCGTASCSARGHARRPHVGRLGEVGVDVDDGAAVEQVGGHGTVSYRSVRVRSLYRPRVGSPIDAGPEPRARLDQLVVGAAEARRRGPRRLCWPSVGAGAADPAVDAGEAERHGGRRMGADHRVVDGLAVAAGDELRVLGRPSRVDRAARPARRLARARSTASSRSRVGRPARQVPVDLVVASPAPGGGRKVGVGRPTSGGRARRRGHATARRRARRAPATAPRPGRRRGPAARRGGCGCRRA